MSSESQLPPSPSSESKLNTSTSTTQSLWEVSKKWILRSLAVSSSVGSLIVVTYFLRIRYLPIDSLSNFASLGAVVALLTCVLLLGYAALLGTPTLLVTFAKSSEQIWNAIAPIFVVNADDTLNSNQPAKASGWRVFLFVFASIGLLWLCLLFWSAPGFVVPAEHHAIAAFVAGLTWLIGLTTYCGHPYSWSCREKSTLKESGCKNLLIKIGWFVIFSCSGAYPMLGYAAMANLSPIDFSGWRLELGFLLFGLAAITLLNGMTLYIELIKRSINSTPTWVIQIAITLSISIFVLVLLGATSRFQDILMQAISVRASRAHIVINKPTCDALRLAGIQVSSYAPLPGEKQPEQCALLGVTILSRLGAQWRIACSHDSTERGDYRAFNIEGKDVITLLDAPSRLEPDPDTSRIGNVCNAMWTP